ncbi:hypothetical protein F5888DRAFT_1058472 [Russula emetica]|nr:hypothetical protein F5888DRAFT_1058472 [Russula emetica]
MIIISAVQSGLHRARQRRAQPILFLRANWLPCCSASLMKRITCWLRSAQNLLAAAEQQRVFDCRVCLDTLPEESIARIDPCGHSFCRECIRGFIVSQIESRRFPVLCPTCTAGPGNIRPESTGSYVSIIRFSE